MLIDSRVNSAKALKASNRNGTILIICRSPNKSAKCCERSEESTSSVPKLDKKD